MCMIISSFNSLHFISLEKDGAIDTPDSHLTPIAIKVAFYQRRESPPWKDAENFNKHSKILDLYPCNFGLQQPELTSWGNMWLSLCLSRCSLGIRSVKLYLFSVAQGETQYKGFLEDWIIFSKDQSAPNHHMWGTIDLLLPEKMLIRMKSQWIPHLPKDRTVCSILRRQHLKFSVGLMWM